MNRIKEYKNKRIKGGFSLVETLVATAIIVMATVGPLGLAGSALSQANYIKDQIVATFLAQEGLEIMRNVRDSQPSGTMATISNYVPICASGCIVSGTKVVSNTYAVDGCGTTCEPLQFNTESNIYEYEESGATLIPTIYTRTIKVYQVPGSSNEYKIYSIVSWERGYGKRSIELTENLFPRTW